MNLFSDQFQYYLTEKGMKIRDVHKYSGLNQTTLYKLLDGTREPTKVEVVEKISDALCLNHEERTELLESYYYTRQGAVGYYGRKEVENFFNNLYLHKVEETQPFLPFGDMTLEKGKSIVLKGKQNVDVAIEYFIYQAASQNPGITIQIREFFKDPLILSIMANILGECPETKFRHVLRLDAFSSEHVEREGTFYNIHTLGEILPFAARHPHYQAFYRYTDLEMEKTQESHLDNVILAGEYSIQYSANHRFCIVERNDQISNLFEKIISEEIGEVQQFVFSLDEAKRKGASEAHHLFYESMRSISGYAYYSDFLNPDFYRDTTLVDYRSLMESLIDLVPTVFVPIPKIESFLSRSNLGHQEKKQHLEHILESIQSGKAALFLTDEQRFPEHFFLECNLSTIYFGVDFQETHPIFLAVNEPTVVHAFYEYLDGINSRESLSSAQSEEYLKQKIHLLEEAEH